MNRAVLVGINDYAKQTPLAGCVNDVLDLDRLFESRHVAEVVVLTDERATKAAIADALIEMVDVLEPGDRGYFHFSGHGVRMQSHDIHEPDGMHEVLCPHDFDWTSATALTDTELLVILDALRLGARLTISIDACHSGDFARGLPPRGRPRTLTPPSSVRSRGPTLRGFRAAARAPNVTFLAACAPWQTAIETIFDGRASGAFTYFLLGELAAPAATLHETATAIETKLCAYAMTPIAENASVTYFGASVPRVATSSRAGMIVFERQWQTSLLGQPANVDVRIAATNGELQAVITTRADQTLASPPIRIGGNLTCSILLGVCGAQVVLAITDWSFGRGTIDFVVQLDMVNERAFVPRTRMPVHIDVTQLARRHLAQVAQPMELARGTRQVLPVSDARE